MTRPLSSSLRLAPRSLVRHGVSLVLVLFVLVAVGFPLTGCEPSDTELRTSSQALAHPGPWVIPPETLAIGDTQHVSYTGAGPWVDEETSCEGVLTQGATELREWFYVVFF